MTSRAGSDTTPKGRGRRPGGTDTRAVIVDAARRSFAAKGYDKASMRGIAREAGVDPALVHHYFEGKAGLFAATLDVPVDLAASQMIGLVVARYVIRVPALADATREQLVERIGPVLQHHLVDRVPEQE